ncbi:N-acetylneuraminate synthase [Psychromonas aquimarina]|uniref:N-acetylneuraminate synthase n=1 Tax=Psychromonas aquimarina TaxID=444919 RepID=UPI0004018554|nr:N-acetylneuraminate synthase [Psychromonas aquimarina]
MSTLIIAEAGVNHNGDMQLAKKLIDVAAGAGADIIKFQTFKAKKLATTSALQAEYQTKNIGKSESQLEMLKRLELKYEDHFILVDYCKHKDISFLSTAFDEESLAFLVDKLGQTLLKIPSGEITNAPLLLAHARTGLDIIISTGMASLSEIEMALGILAFGYSQTNETPSVDKFETAYYSEKGQAYLKEKVRILHCTTEYPAPLEEINLNAMLTIRDSFKLPVGYSDHSEGIIVPVAAVAKGARIIEKHFTLDQNMEGPDHKASLEPTELQEMIALIKKVEIIEGNGIKGPSSSEIKNKVIVRKSIVATRSIKKGETFTEDCLAIKRPGNGISPINYWDVVGKRAIKDFKEDELII